MSSAYTLILKNVKQETLNLIFLNILIDNIGVASLYIVNCATYYALLGKTTSKLVNTDTSRPLDFDFGIHNTKHCKRLKTCIWQAQAILGVRTD